MIAHISGTIAEKFAGSVIVDVSGVGYEIIVPAGEFERAVLKEQYTLRTHHITKIEEEFFSKIHDISSQELLKYIKLCKYEKYFNDYFKGDVLYEELKRRYNISTTNSENEIVNG